MSSSPSTSSYSNRSILVATTFALSSALVAEIINKTVPDPYLVSQSNARSIRSQERENVTDFELVFFFFVTRLSQDEIFHIPQAQAYCQSKWNQWDPKLTTPPGLYLFSISIHKLLPRYLIRGLGPCTSVSFLRTTNLFLLMILPHLISSLLNSIEEESREDQRLEQPPSYLKTMTSTDQQDSMEKKPLRVPKDPSIKVAKALQKSELKPMESSKDARRSIQNRMKSKGIQTDFSNFRRTFQSHVISLLPPLYFFGFLYYTDVGSLVMVLSSLLAAKKRRHLVAGVLGGFSLFFRQTNIVWLAFITSISIVRELKFKGLLYDPVVCKIENGQSLFETLLKSISSLFSILERLNNIKLILTILLPYLPIFGGFVAFLKWNGGIVLGDQSNHQAGLHLPQLFYFAVFSTFFSFPTLFQTLNLSIFTPKSFFNFLETSVFKSKSRVFTLFIALILSLTSIHFKTFEHPFLLADNRHYTFYVWRKIVKFHPLVKYFLSPIYLISGLLWFEALSKSCSLIWLIGFFTSISLTLIPSPLIEPRYFLIPFILMRIHLKSNFKEKESKSKVDEEVDVEGGEDWKSFLPLIGEGCWYLLINSVTIWVFLNKPFRWQSEEGWQRFMW